MLRRLSINWRLDWTFQRSYVAISASLLRSRAMSDLAKVASTLAASGPYKHEGTPKRIRVNFAGETIFDTIESQLVWEHPYYPQYYIPRAALKYATLSPGRDAGEGRKGFQIHDLSLHGKVAKDAVLSVEDGPLSGFLRPSFPDMDQWLEEDEPIHGHPVDPYKRVDVRRSSRQIRVEVNGVEVANAPWSVHLFETSLPVRYYLPRPSVNAKMLRPSTTTSYCPYKGSANYYDVVTAPGSDPVRDIVWYYETPLLAVESIRELACFYNEKVDIWIDGVKQTRPKSKFG